jgi:hypothetical protein
LSLAYAHSIAALNSQRFRKYSRPGRGGRVDKTTDLVAIFYIILEPDIDHFHDKPPVHEKDFLERTIAFGKETLACWVSFRAP